MIATQPKGNQKNRIRKNNSAILGIHVPGWPFPSLEKAYGPRFYRMWEFYLHACAGAFRSRKYKLWQLVLSRHGVRVGYATIR